MRTILKILLFLAACILTYLCIKSISEPVRFTSEKEKRERVVMRQMLFIHEAEISFFEKKGFYTDNFDILVHNIKSDTSFLKRNMIGISLDSIQFIPYSDGKLFTLQVGEATGENGESVIAYEIKAPFELYLKGMNGREIEQLKLDAMKTGNYPGLRMSSSYAQ